MKPIDLDGLDVELLKIRLLSLVKFDCIKGCWIWQGPKIGQGYGSIRIRPKDQQIVSRVSLKIFRQEEFLPGFDSLHTCDVKMCINPYHLYWGTDRENKLDAAERKINANSRKTHCNKGHLLSGSNLRIESGKYRRCMICVRQGVNHRRFLFGRKDR